jgi:16S rRNA (adenine1518-N6/adenine1519-N6)-dimethyltransferase
LIDLLLSEVSFARLCFTVQDEMADRIQARAGTKDYGPVSILMQTFCVVKRIAKLPPQVFWPAPQVDSAMMRLDVKEGGVIEGPARQCLVDTVRHAFNHRRKTLRHSLRSLLEADVWRRIDEGTDFDLTQRPEQWPPPQWVAFAKCLNRQISISPSSGSL